MVKSIYCGTEEFVDFFEKVIELLDLSVKYQVVDIDGELEIIIDKELNYEC